MSERLKNILMTLLLLITAGVTNAWGTDRVLSTTANRILRGSKTWNDGLAGGVQNKWALPTADAVKNDLGESTFVSATGFYWGQCNGNSGNDTDLKNLATTGFQYCGRQAYKGQFATQIYILEENVSKVDVSFTLSGTTSTASFSIWGYSASSGTATQLAASTSSWSEGTQSFSASNAGLVTGDRLILIWNANNAGKTTTISNFSCTTTGANSDNNYKLVHILHNAFTNTYGTNYYLATKTSDSYLKLETDACRDDIVWRLEPTGTTNQYYIYNMSTGKYIYSSTTSSAAAHAINMSSSKSSFVITDITGGTTSISPSGNTEASFNPYGGNTTDDIGYYYLDSNGYWRIEDAQCGDPEINVSDGEATLTTSTCNATIYYTTDETTPTTSSQLYNGAFTVTSGTTIKAIAVRNYYYNSNVSSYYYETAIEAVSISALSEITNMKGNYMLSEDFVVDTDPVGTSSAPFQGIVDGQFNKISNLTQSLFGVVKNATIKNVIVDNVEISGSGNRGAIANEATGYARIYNCGVLATNSTFEFDKTYSSSSTVTSTDAAAGSIVGVISGNARVLNCYSYADVEGSTYSSGIVGKYDDGSWIQSTGTSSNNCFVMNCMFYGNITGGTRSPIVGGSAITDNYSIYSYFRYKSITNTSFNAQNGALAIQEDIWLKRFAFFQAAVTNHRDLAALYCFNDATRISEIAQWYIDETIAPWPILRKAEARKSTLNRTIPNTGNANEGNLITNAPADIKKRYNMSVGSGGYLTVNYTINDGTVSTSNSVQLPVTDMDFEHYDYTWGKVVLPFINEFDAWRDATNKDYGKVCIGWEITSMDATGKNSFSDYNYADRDCTAKDIYDATSNPILYAEGGNFIVPYGVTAININAHFANAFYLSDASYDCSGGGGNARGTRPTTYHGKTVYTSAAAAWYAMTETTSSPNVNAIVLVGNYHYTSDASSSYTGKGCTVLSVDDDNDQQPDYGWYNNGGSGRATWPSIRWTFIPIFGFNMAQTNTSYPGLNIPKATGWFEMTETCLCRTYEFESNDGARTYEDDGHGNNCYIINGGWFQQIVRCYNSGTANKLSYMKVGGNAYVKEFFHGNHSGTNLTYTLRPIVVTGGEIVSCYMTGMGSKKEVVETDNNVRFYCAGGKINKYLSAYNGYPVVNATMKVDHAYINRFFGGGTTQIARLKGSIDVTMNYSDVTFFCGGPEFGDMADGTTVTVSTTGSTFGEYYGAGYGGTALTRITNGDGQKDPFGGNGGARLNYDADAGGYEVSYEMENLLNYVGAALYRYYDYRAALSLATAGSVTTNAKKCLFKNSFYGGGCQGKVKGTITSTLTDCDVTGSAFGGGYKAAATTISVYPTGGNTWPSWNDTYKAFSDAVYPTADTYTWVQGEDGTVDESAKTLGVSSSTVDMTTMGQVTGDIKITVQASADGAATVGGSVFGGGNESASLEDTEVKILGNTSVAGSVYGGGNMATVGGTTTVQIGEECK